MTYGLHDGVGVWAGMGIGYVPVQIPIDVRSVRGGCGITAVSASKCQSVESIH